MKKCEQMFSSSPGRFEQREGQSLVIWWPIEANQHGKLFAHIPKIVVRFRFFGIQNAQFSQIFQIRHLCFSSLHTKTVLLKTLTQSNRYVFFLVRKNLIYSNRRTKNGLAAYAPRNLFDFLRRKNGEIQNCMRARAVGCLVLERERCCLFEIQQESEREREIALNTSSVVDATPEYSEFRKTINGVCVCVSVYLCAVCNHQKAIYASTAIFRSIGRSVGGWLVRLSS